MVAKKQVTDKDVEQKGAESVPHVSTGVNPFKTVFADGVDSIMAMDVKGGVVLKYNDAMCFVPGIDCIDRGEVAVLS